MAIGCSACRRRCRPVPGSVTGSRRLSPMPSTRSCSLIHCAMSIGIGAPSPLLAELRALTRDRERLVWNQRDVENQLRAVVQVYHPGVLHLFSSLDRDIALAFLRDYPTPAHAGRIGSARMAAFCARHGY